MGKKKNKNKQPGQQNEEGKAQEQPAATEPKEPVGEQ